jgi:hypothetical protein
LVGLTAGGLQVVGESGGGAGCAVQFGVAGEVEPRVTIGADGSLNYRSNETAATITTVETVQSNTTGWDPPSLAPGAAARYTVLLRGSRRGDIAAASLSSIDDEFVQLSAIARDGVVAVVLRNAEGGHSGRPVDIAVGKLRVVVTAFGSDQPAQKTDDSGPTVAQRPFVANMTDPQGKKYACFRIPALQRVGKTILLFAEGRAGTPGYGFVCRDHGDVRIVLRRSTDEGPPDLRPVRHSCACTSEALLLVATTLAL